MCRHSLRSDGAGFYQLAGVMLPTY
ncbi:DUF2575 family protein [Escherichia coli]|nr:DUF2575 family protein [Escherichia coli]